MGSQEWQQKELNILVDKDASGIEFGGVLSGKGIGWFDNFTFEIITSPVLSSEAQNYLDEVFQIIENNSIRIDSLDLPRYRKLVSLNASGAEKPKDCYPSIRLALNMLKDNHSFLMDPVATRDWESSTYSGDTKKAMPAGRLIAREDKQYAFISVPGMMSKNSADIDIFADSIQTLIRTLDQKV